MPRHGNTIETKTRHYRAMASVAHGKGGDAKIRLAKQKNGTKAKPAKPDRRKSRDAEELGTASLDSSVAEHLLGKKEAAGSIPAPGSKVPGCLVPGCLARHPVYDGRAWHEEYGA
jgi:hypothetical protein